MDKIRVFRPFLAEFFLDAAKIYEANLAVYQKIIFCNQGQYFLINLGK
ncbi:hypothetical protein [uncultured Sneathiella sp.]|nr:hypothetical protein [uncultured Sneathiella sp.]